MSNLDISMLAKRRHQRRSWPTLLLVIVLSSPRLLPQPILLTSSHQSTSPRPPPCRIHISSCLISDKTAVAAIRLASLLKGKEVMEIKANIFVQSYVRELLVLERGQGCMMYDVEGREHLDMMAEITVNSMRHSNPNWLKSVMEQEGTLTHISNMYSMSHKLNRVNYKISSMYEITVPSQFGCRAVRVHSRHRTEGIAS